VPPARLEPRFAATSQLIEADCGNGPEESDAGYNREEERHQRSVGGQHRGGDADEGVDQPGEHQIATHFLEVLQPQSQRRTQILVADLAYRDSLDPRRPARGHRLGRHDTSFKAVPSGATGAGRLFTVAITEMRESVRGSGA
jgi:hypothetical protein